MLPWACSLPISHAPLIPPCCRSGLLGAPRGERKSTMGRAERAKGSFLICHLSIISKSSKMGSPGPMEVLRGKTRPSHALSSLAVLNPHCRASYRPEFQHLHVKLLTSHGISRHVPSQRCPRQQPQPRQGFVKKCFLSKAHPVQHWPCPWAY